MCLFSIRSAGSVAAAAAAAARCVSRARKNDIWFSSFLILPLVGWMDVCAGRKRQRNANNWLQIHVQPCQIEEAKKERKNISVFFSRLKLKLKFTAWCKRSKKLNGATTESRPLRRTVLYTRWTVNEVASEKFASRSPLSLPLFHIWDASGTDVQWKMFGSRQQAARWSEKWLACARACE